ncbi:hypothetical protein C453_01530 [Haloferax elongans ATCC BAA-1513]|uniref:Histidine kinase n=1 Tax=Haloferax elongans ATCC BAA-1513 TaxID=1230453 RepID=M0HZG9_HALEO|nr:hypothetical protein [Haloferax elongans]ELZ88504.1 hypothetical protein C453_01530 [Haloferax elongans ATCC BAA-1513]
MTDTTESITDVGQVYTQSLATRIKAVPTLAWIAAAVGGFIGSIPLGLMMQYGNPEPLIALALPMMYGLSGPDLVSGWVIHQFHGIALAVMYVAAVQWQPLTEYAKTLRGAVALAVVVGVVSTALLSVLLMPLWLGAVGYPFTPTFPDLAMPEKLWSVLGHVIYALPATIGYALVMRR